MEWGATNNSNQTSTAQNNAISEASSEGKIISNIKGSSEARTAKKSYKTLFISFSKFWIGI